MGSLEGQRLGTEIYAAILLNSIAKCERRLSISVSVIVDIVGQFWMLCGDHRALVNCLVMQVIYDDPECGSRFWVIPDMKP
jgi:hypothetical protein